MDLFRSELMHLARLIVPVESAHHTMVYLGELGSFQFKDLNSDKSPFQRTYAKQVKRCGEMLRKVRFLKDQLERAGIPTTSGLVASRETDIDELEVKLTELETELANINANNDLLMRSYSELLEFQLVLQKAGTFFYSAQQNANAQQEDRDESASPVEESIETPLLEQEMGKESSKQGRLGSVTGLVAKSKIVAFERILFRATRGNVYIKIAEIGDPVLDPATGEKMEKVVFLVFYSGERAKHKIMKICEAFGANRYPFPEDISRQAQMLEEVSGRISEMKVTIDAAKTHRDMVLSSIAADVEWWASVVKREKAVHHILNMLSVDVTKKCLVAEGWCPVSAEPKIQEALQLAAYDSNSEVVPIFQIIKTKEMPPTYFRTNKFSGAFQEIVDAYGVSRYREANPALFTIVTFPFLFAVMFGDWGHGICLLLAVLWLLVNEKKYGSQKLGDIMSMAYSGRYVILLMAIFSIYTGLIYNEFFSVPFSMFGSSSYHCSDSSCSTAYTTGLVKTRSRPYAFGVDPVWHGSSTELTFLNSLKMKMSILLGVAQMDLGIFLSFLNALYFRNDLNIWYQFVPQVIFLNALFGYLSLLILVKWCMGARADLYHVMIYMFLSPTADLGENQLFPGQKYVQMALLLLAVVAIPWMLLPKPLIMRSRYIKKSQEHAYTLLGDGDAEFDHRHNEVDEDEEHEEFEFSEVLVHQMIHTIEFVLGAVSNTASYLRLWALSLAHSELSAVFYDKILLLTWGFNNVIIFIVGIIIFAFATIGVLLCMETLSAFLHALRLHWVEFQNKFYEGDGYKFKPYSFAALDEEDD